MLLLEVEHDRHRSPQLEVRVAVDEEGEAAHRVDLQVILLPEMKEMSFRYLLLFEEVFLTMGRVANTYNANQIFRLVSGSSVCFWVYKMRIRHVLRCGEVSLMMEVTNVNRKCEPGKVCEFERLTHK